MPKREDVKSILILGAGPIVIGQACEFDYSGTQACKALREEGYRLVLVNSNPATIMTDPDTAHAVYIEPLHWKTVAKIIEKEKPDALLPTMGGQTALNCALDLAKHGVLQKHRVEMLGVKEESIDKAEDRKLFSQAMKKIGLKMPNCGMAHNMEEALEVIERTGFPAIIRPSFTLGGTGGGIAYNRVEFTEICERGLDLSPTSQLLIDESIIGWKEYEMEVIRDKNDNCIIVCSIENVDAMGIHTGDSITVAPAQTLTDKEFQIMRNASIAVMREIDVTAGASNVQFAVNPQNGDLRVIEMNPRVSRSSALASKATGFPIAKVVAKLAVGYTLDELKNEITNQRSPIAFEPSIDYIVTKIPRFNFEKFPETDPRLTTQMKSVGEVMGIGRSFQESLQKALRSLEIDAHGLKPMLDPDTENAADKIRFELSNANPKRLFYVADAFRFGLSIDDVQKLSHIDPWFLTEIKALIDSEMLVSQLSIDQLDADMLFKLKRQGFSDIRLATLTNTTEEIVRKHRQHLKVHPVYKRIDSCAAEFPTDTAYMYSTYEKQCEANPTDSPEKIIVLGGGPNRIGQGIEFDYCCVHAAMAMRESGYETIMVNCNPETISTDYDSSDRLYFEPLTLEDLLEIIAIEKPKGIIVQYGGQTPLKLSRALEAAGAPIIGTSPDAIDRAEDRERFQQVVEKLKLQQPDNGTVRSIEEGKRLANVLAYPLVVRPSYVLGGRAMEIVRDKQDFLKYLQNNPTMSADEPLLLDQFLDNAIEVDIDAVSDGKHVMIAGILQHIEQAGIHSGDSACSLPAHDLDPKIQEALCNQTRQMALELGVVGLLNAQFAIQDGSVYVLEVNPRASRTVPFVSKAVGIPLAKIAAVCMAGKTLAEQGFTMDALPAPQFYSVKQPVFPFDRFPGVDPILGPEMRSTGEVMGIGQTFGEAFAKGLLSGNQPFPESGRVFVSVRDADKPWIGEIAKQLLDLGFTLIATRGTAETLTKANIACEHVNKVTEGRPHIVDMIKNDEIAFVINTTEGSQAIADSFTIRRSAIQHKVPCTTTLAGAKATCLALQERHHSGVYCIQTLHEKQAEMAPR